MPARIIDGRTAAKAIRLECAAQVRALAKAGVTPGLAVVLVGDDPASAVYVRNKIQACSEVGIASSSFRCAADIDQQSLSELIRRLNADPLVHGILLQLPLPAHIDAAGMLDAICAEKDVDGFHVSNLGALTAGRPGFAPCTPAGIMRLLDREETPIEGANAVVVGASNIVGKPMALMLAARGATVTLCHRKTRDLGMFTRQAEILVVAAGCPDLIGPDMVMEGATVIDVGVNRLADGRLVGDVSPTVAGRAGRLTPVPGGVGPMTVTMLLVNTIAAAGRAAAAPLSEAG